MRGELKAAIYIARGDQITTTVVTLMFDILAEPFKQLYMQLIVLASRHSVLTKNNAKNNGKFTLRTVSVNLTENATKNAKERDNDHLARN